MQPTEKIVIKEYSNIDEYQYRFESVSSSRNVERISLITQDDIVCIIRLSQTGNIRSEYNILGIHIGESKSSAESIGKAYFGEDGTWQKIAGIESVSYGSDTSDEGILTIIFDPQTNKVSSVNYHKTPND